MEFKVGDKVRVLRKARTHEKDWQNSWIPKRMDAAVGKIGKVLAVDPERQDVEIAFPGVYGTWGYPAFVLQKIRKPSTKRKRK